MSWWSGGFLLVVCATLIAVTYGDYKQFSTNQPEEDDEYQNPDNFGPI